MVPKIRLSSIRLSSRRPPNVQFNSTGEPAPNPTIEPNPNVEFNSTAVRPRGLHLAKRFDNARFTSYDPSEGTGACGATKSASDFVVALNSAQSDNLAHCFQTITINAEGKTTQAQIMDVCFDCPPNGLDLSSGLFAFFAPLGTGVITGSWDFA